MFCDAYMRTYQYLERILLQRRFALSGCDPPPCFLCVQLYQNSTKSNSHKKPHASIMDSVTTAAATVTADTETAEDHLGRDPQFDAVDAETRTVMQNRVNSSVQEVNSESTSNRIIWGPFIKTKDKRGLNITDHVQ